MGLHKPNIMPRPTKPTAAMSPVQATRFIKFLCEQGSHSLARKLFDQMPDRDVVSWTAMISGYASSHRHEDAWGIFRRMMDAGVGPNAFTISSVLTACRGPRWRAGCGVAHAVAVRRGVDTAPYVENSLLDAYASCGDGMADARALFDRLQERSAVSWTTMIAGYTRLGQGDMGIQMFRRMLQDGTELSPFACSIAISACSLMRSLMLGRLLHSMSLKCGFDSNLPVANSLVDMYCRCMSIEDGKRYFTEMPRRDLITWNTMISGLDRYSSCEALQLFLEMSSRNVKSNCFTYTSIVASCAKLAVLRCGQQVHGAIVCRGFGENLQICNALIDMYCKCGSVADSEKIFSAMSCRDLLSWTSMMIGYGMNGLGYEAMQLFNEMVDGSIRLDYVVFVGLISACSHAGLVEEGWRYFNLMTTKYSVQPNWEVYGCVVDLLGRAGRLIEAFEVIQSMPFEPDESIWGALLGACKMHKNAELGSLAAQKMVELKPKGSAKTYLVLSNIYAADNEWGQFAATRKLMRGMDSKKEAGTSWIELGDKVCSFVAGDRSNSCVGLAVEVLDSLIEHMHEAGNVSEIYKDLEAVK
ncbi:putative pentatricopeptide repeat-containing protein At1g56570 [Typha angustifolia]|uniref:putative pentatricopeptide repeat-containing protein At1g56570 n=1 Tax=Typha angustifolia TaxID=59011 RepID=UPI003C2EDFA4